MTEVTSDPLGDNLGLVIAQPKRTVLDIADDLAKTLIGDRAETKDLKPAHLRILALHLEGTRTKDIAKMCHVTTATVRNVLKSPGAQIIIDEFTDDFKDEMRILFGEAVNVIREGLDDDDIEIRLKAVDRFTKLVQPDNSAPMQQNNTQINIYNKVSQTREKFVDVLKEFVETSESTEAVIEGIAEEIHNEE